VRPNPRHTTDQTTAQAGEQVVDSRDAGGRQAADRVVDRGRHHGNRYGRSERARQAVLEAADDLLVERGFAGVTIEGIAARAGVAKQTIYRWWPSKVDVLMDAFIDDMAQHLTPPDQGDLGRDLRTHLSRLADFLTRSDAGAVFAALVGQAQHDAQLATQLRADYFSQQRTRDRLPLLRAVDRGQLARDTDLELAVDQLLGPIYYRVLVTGQPVGSEFTDALVNQFLTQYEVQLPHGPAEHSGRVHHREGDVAAAGGCPAEDGGGSPGSTNSTNNASSAKTSSPTIR
jgi:AcrR family transcriptional regulator